MVRVEVFVGLGVDDPEVLGFQHQLLDVGQRDVALRLRVVLRGDSGIS
jgi:hypothetical protein